MLREVSPRKGISALGLKPASIQTSYEALKSLFTKLVPSAEADSYLSTFAVPALTRWANECRRSAANERFVPRLGIGASLVTGSEPRVQPQRRRAGMPDRHFHRC